MFKLMIAEDNPYQLDEIADIIDWEDYDISLSGMFTNGKDLIKNAMVEQPDIVLTDISMPIMGGIEVAEKIRSMFPYIPVIFMSSYSEFEYAKAALDLDVIGYILKPIQREQIKEVMQLALTKLQEVQRQKIEKEVQIHETDELRAFALKIYLQALLGCKEDENEIHEKMKVLCMPEIKDRILYVARFALDNITEKTPVNEEKELSTTLKAYADSNIQFRLVEIKGNYGTILCLAKPNIDIAVMLTKLCVDVEITMSCRCTIGYSKPGRGFKRLAGLMQQANVTLYSMLKEKASCPIAGYEDIHPLNAHSQEDIQIDILEWLQINDDLTDTGESDQHFLSKRAIQEIEKIDWKLQDFLKEQDVEFILHANTNEAIQRILKCLQNAKQSAKDDASHVYSKNVKAMREYILNHFAEKISAKEVAKAVFLSASYANARFTEECGITIFEYIMECRMNRAKYLLRTTEERVSWVAEQVGYGEKTSFYLAFKRNVGISPTDYRTQLTE